MSMTRRVLAATAGILIGTGAVLAAPTAAQAGTTGSACTRSTATYGHCAGYVSFNHDGEIFEIWDMEADGAGQIVYISINDHEIAPLTYSGGADTRKKFNLSIAEGDTVSFQICIKDGGTVFTSTCQSGSATA
jgi:hypothetical protein